MIYFAIFLIYIFNVAAFIGNTKDIIALYRETCFLAYDNNLHNIESLEQMHRRLLKDTGSLSHVQFVQNHLTEPIQLLLKLQSSIILTQFTSSGFQEDFSPPPAGQRRGAHRCCL